ncbi:MAG: hypothetical protein ACKVT0_09555 [Planctomycetaceae bacterium]
MRPDSVLESNILPHTPDATLASRSTEETSIQPAPGWFKKKPAPQVPLSHVSHVKLTYAIETEDPVIAEAAAVAQAPLIDTSPPPVKQVPVDKKNPSDRARKSPKPVGPVVEDVPEPLLTPRQKVILFITGSAGMGYLLSFLSHISALLILAFVFFPEIVGEHGFSLVMSTDESHSDQELIDTKFVMPEIAAVTEVPNVLLPMIPTPTITETELPDDITSRIQESVGNGISAEEQSSGTGDGGDFAGAPGKNAVFKGSFAAWTVPEDPEPGEDYKIVVRVKLPERVKRRYPVSDLSGVVIGTDGYRQVIPGITKLKTLKVLRGYTQFDVTVPGAYRLVKDKIVVRSKMLEEEQLLEIVF